MWPDHSLLAISATTLTLLASPTFGFGWSDSREDLGFGETRTLSFFGESGLSIECMQTTTESERLFQIAYVRDDEPWDGTELPMPLVGYISGASSRIELQSGRQQAEGLNERLEFNLTARQVERLLLDHLLGDVRHAIADSTGEKVLEFTSTLEPSIGGNPVEAFAAFYDNCLPSAQLRPLLGWSFQFGYAGQIEWAYATLRGPAASISFLCSFSSHAMGSGVEYGVSVTVDADLLREERYESGGAAIALPSGATYRGDLVGNRFTESEIAYLGFARTDFLRVLDDLAAQSGQADLIIDGVLTPLEMTLSGSSAPIRELEDFCQQRDSLDDG